MRRSPLPLSSDKDKGKSTEVSPPSLAIYIVTVEDVSVKAIIAKSNLTPKTVNYYNALYNNRITSSRATSFPRMLAAAKAFNNQIIGTQVSKDCDVFDSRRG